jgi:hypothetical protein
LKISCIDEEHFNYGINDTIEIRVSSSFSNDSTVIHGIVKQVDNPKCILLQLNNEDEIALLQQWIATGKAITKKVREVSRLSSFGCFMSFLR